jgi:hypothetical protein
MVQTILWRINEDNKNVKRQVDNSYKREMNFRGISDENS